MLNPFINTGLEVALKDLFRDKYTTGQVYPATATDVCKERLIVYVYPNSLKFVFVDQEQEALEQLALNKKEAVFVLKGHFI
jgi:hypothetical protein